MDRRATAHTFVEFKTAKGETLGFLTLPQSRRFPGALVGTSEIIQNLLTKREGANTQMDISLMIGAPLGLGILIALGILFVVMSYLTQ